MTTRHELPVTAQVVPTVYFFGVTTGQSSSRRLFPLWMDILGRPEAQLVGVDLPLDGPPEGYRRAVHQIKYDPFSRGAVITSHKLNTLQAARDLFDVLTPETALTGEVSAIYKDGEQLIGHATDPAASGQAMRQFTPAGYWQRTGASILCLGAGGSATALAAYFSTIATPAERPPRLTFVDRRRDRLDALRILIETKMTGTGITFEYVESHDPAENDALLAELPPGSLVINATGMGKDRPGSPLTDAGRFPEAGFAWDLNYRGELDFLRQARQQEASRHLTTADGWFYFLTGWATIIGQIFAVPITPPVFAQLAEAAAAVR